MGKPINLFESTSIFSMEIGNSDNNPYSLEGSTFYDIEAAFISDRYKEAHRIQNSIVINALNNIPNPVIIDFGCGTGSDGLEILSKLSTSHYIGIDSSIYMLQVASKKFEKEILSSRSLFIKQDIRNLTNDWLLKELSSSMIITEISCIISSLVLHHYSIETRVRFYKLAFQLLKNNGVFLLTDLFSNAINICNQFALDRELNDVRDTINKLENQGIHTNGFTTISPYHYIYQNHPYDLLNETTILVDIGFNKIDVIFRSGQLALLIISK
jgi:SAM-dependent methyltransferase